MLDYAAHATVYWTVEGIRNSFEKTCAARGVDPDETLEAFLGGAAGESLLEQKQYWENVQTNLRAGKVRLLIVADTIPSELQRIIEFLNEQMDPAEFLGIAIKQYKADGLRTLVPRVVGLTTAGEGRKAGRSGHRSPRQRWSVADYYEAVEKIDVTLAATAMQITDHFSQIADVELSTGTGVNPSISIHANLPQRVSLFVLGISNDEPFIQHYFYLHKRHTPFDEQANLDAWKATLYKIDGATEYLNRTQDAPSFPLHLLFEDGLTKFTSAYDWLIQCIATRSMIEQSNTQ